MMKTRARIQRWFTFGLVAAMLTLASAGCASHPVLDFHAPVPSDISW